MIALPSLLNQSTRHPPVSARNNVNELKGIEIGKDWEGAYRAWELASEGKYDPALELGQTITDNWHKSNAN